MWHRSIQRILLLLSCIRKQAIYDVLSYIWFILVKLKANFWCDQIGSFRNSFTSDVHNVLLRTLQDWVNMENFVSNCPGGYIWSIFLISISICVLGTPSALQSRLSLAIHGGSFGFKYRGGSQLQSNPLLLLRILMDLRAHSTAWRSFWKGG